MKAMLLAFVTLIVISFGANYALEQSGFSSADRTSGGAVRLD